MIKKRRTISMILVLLMLAMSPLQVLATEAEEGSSQQEATETQEEETKDNGTVPEEAPPIEEAQPEEEVLPAEEALPTEEALPAEGVSAADPEVETQQVSEIVEYAYIESQQISQEETQNIVISLKNKNTAVESAVLDYTNEAGEEFSTELSAYAEGVMLFVPETNMDLGSYQLNKLTYLSEQTENIIDLQQEGIQASFSVVSKEEKEQAENAEEQEPQVETSVRVIGEDGGVEEAASVEEGIAIAKGQQGTDLAAAVSAQGTAGVVSRRSRAGNIVVVLDPGHDNPHTGAAENGISENIYTLQIAKACRAELQRYNGVEVYLTVEENGNTRWPGSTVGECLKNRVEYAKNVGADLFVSMHLNAFETASAYGAEVYVSNYSKYKGEGTELANKVLSELQKLGLSNRGIKVNTNSNHYDDGSAEDSLSVIRNSTYSGFPSVLIEHGFLSNASDASIIKTKTEALGQADAKAIAEQLNLIGGPFGMTPAGQTFIGDTVTLTAYPQHIASGYNQYQFICYDGKDWTELNGYSGSTSYKWKPKKVGNNYILGVRAKNSSGSTQQYVLWSYFKVTEPTITISGIDVKESQNGMVLQLTPKVTSDTGEIKYRYQTYDVNRKIWSTIKDNTQDTSVTWSPPKSGVYWLHVVAISATGKESTYTMGYTVDAGRASISSFTSSASGVNVGQSITLKASYKVLSDKSNKHQFMVYNGQYWEDITGSSKTSATWKPQKAGNHLLCYQITTSTGKIYQSFIGMEVKGSQLTIHGINTGKMNAKGEIALSANVSGSGTGINYTFLAYDMKNWITIREKSTSQSAIWKPQKSGPHLLYLRVTDSAGKEYTYSMGYGVPDLVKINGFSANKNSPQGIGSSVTLSANVTISSSIKATYEYMYYNGKYWVSINKASSLKSAVWKPNTGGSFLVCFQIVTAAGQVYQSFMGYEITEPQTNIRGIYVGDPNEKGQIALQAQVDTNDSNLKYTYKAYDMKNWALISENGSSQSATWAPKKAGVYLLYLEVQGSTGKTSSYAMGVQIKDDLRITGLSKSVFSPQKVGTDIALTGRVSTLFPSGLTYEYLVYDGKYWSCLASSSKLDKVTWTPKTGGTYAVCFQVTDKDGKVLQWFESYVIEAPKVTINGISVGQINSAKQVKLTANVSTNDSALRYTFKAYDMKHWASISENSTSASATWNVPKEGTYLLYLEVRDSAGIAHTYAMGCVQQNNIKITGFSSNLKSPQKIKSGLAIKFLGTVSATYQKGLTFRYMQYDGKYWNLIGEMKDVPAAATWKPQKKGDYLVCFQVETESGRQINQFVGYSVGSYYYIMGDSSTTASQMVTYFKANNTNYDKYTKVNGYNGVLARGGASTIEQYCKIFVEEAKAEGVKAEVAFSQAMLETGFLKYGGDVKPDQYNFAGLGATGGGEPGNRFKTVREGIRAQIQHLKCYASTAPLSNPCVDQRWSNSLRGTATTVESLSLKWAVGSTYGEQILTQISKLCSY